ncbi:hypothetical protein [Bifidobacterium animalis]|nr:hypothetical protein [Bifidobacterium animalis]
MGGQYAKHNPDAAIADNVEDIPRLLGQLKPPQWPVWLGLLAHV